MIGTMSLKEILQLPSVDGGGDTVEDFIKEWYDGITTWPGYSWLTDAMREDGFNKIPIHIASATEVWEAYCDEDPPDFLLPDEKAMGNGHHRVAIALELGFTEMRYSDDLYETGW